MPPPVAFPDRTGWRYVDTLKAVDGVSLHAYIAAEGDVALFADGLPGDNAALAAYYGTVVMVSEYHDTFWLRARHRTGADVSWQVRGDRRGNAEIRTSGYHGVIGPAVCCCVAVGHAVSAFLLDHLGPGYAAFAAAVRAAVVREIAERNLPRRLAGLLDAA